MEITKTFHNYQIYIKFLMTVKMAHDVEIDKIEKSKTEKVDLTIKF